MFKKVLLAGAIIGLLNGCGITPTADGYVDAIINQDVEVLKIYEDKSFRKIAVNHKESQPINIQYTKHPLHTAILLNKPQVVEFLLSNKHDINKYGSDGKTPLGLAVSLEKELIVQLLLDNGANVNVADKKGLIPFIYLTDLAKVNKKYAGKLINNKTDLNKKYKGKTIIEHVKVSEDIITKVKLTELILAQSFMISSARNKMMKSLGSKSTEALKEFIRDGYDVDFFDKNYYSPLMEAVKNSNIKAVTLLLNEGANPNLRDSKYGETAVFEALKLKSTDILDELIKHNVDINIAKSSSWTPLLSAVSSNKVSMVKALIKAGADVNKA
ncbi:ankyrin repeat domain-containing protein, partial [Pseudoalteromonas sp. '520P1 No. 412']